MNPSQLLAVAERAVSSALPVIMDWYRRSEREIEAKADESPVTAADLAAHDAITRVLTRETPEVPIFSEEAAAPPVSVRQRWQRYWLLDPLDGTREFIARNGEFTVNLALIEAGRPLLGVVGVPARNELYVGLVPERRAERLTGDQREPISVRHCPAQPRVLVTRSNGNAELQTLVRALRRRLGPLDVDKVGSALKLVELACGRADGYPRCSPCCEWDIAAGEAVLLAAGGRLLDRAGRPLAYNKVETILHPDFWAVADPEGRLAEAFAALMRDEG